MTTVAMSGRSCEEAWPSHLKSLIGLVSTWAPICYSWWAGLTKTNRSLKGAGTAFVSHLSPATSEKLQETKTYENYKALYLCAHWHLLVWMLTTWNIFHHGSQNWKKILTGQLSVSINVLLSFIFYSFLSFGWTETSLLICYHWLSVQWSTTLSTRCAACSCLWPVFLASSRDPCCCPETADKPQV